MKFVHLLKIALLSGALLMVCLAGQFSAARVLQSDEPASDVGNEACAKCHAEIARRYANTPMANTSGVVTSDTATGEFFHQASGVRYRISKEPGKNKDAVWLSYERKGDAPLQGRRQLHYFIGSNAAGRSFLFAPDRFLFQAPVTWYATAKKWDASPGYEADRELRLNRPVDANCLYCHASQAQPIYGALNRYAEPPFKQAGISCERCHGPGSLHVAGKASMAMMVNPTKLDAARRDSVCAQCHLSGAARVELPRRRLAFYRPGERLADYVSYFVPEQQSEAGLKVNSHVEKLAQSVCAQKAGERMSCLSCHDPHSVPEARERAAYFRGKCLTCHQVAALPANQQHTAQADCIKCHMPKTGTTDGGHGVMTDHSIQRERRMPHTSPHTSRMSGERRLIAFTGFSSDAHSLGLAYAERAALTGDKFAHNEARRLLQEALPTNATDAELLTRLAFLYQAEGDIERALTLYETALQSEPERVPQCVIAAVNAGSLHAARGNLKRAVTLWQDALQRNPGLREAALNLAAALRAQGESQQAEEIVRQLLRFDPDALRGQKPLLH
jgi:tetratricopeptide (TPR) repeat protein